MHLESEPDREAGLLKALGDADWRVRRKAVDALLREGDKHSLALFIRKLRR
jgi:HEAT repeat protein